MVSHDQWAMHGLCRRKRALGQKGDGGGGWHLIGAQHGFRGWRSWSLLLPQARVCPTSPLQHIPPSHTSGGRFVFQSCQLSLYVTLGLYEYQIHKVMFWYTHGPWNHGLLSHEWVPKLSVKWDAVMSSFIFFPLHWWCDNCWFCLLTTTVADKVKKKKQKNYEEPGLHRQWCNKTDRSKQTKPNDGNSNNQILPLNGKGGREDVIMSSWKVFCMDSVNTSAQLWIWRSELVITTFKAFALLLIFAWTLLTLARTRATEVLEMRAVSGLPSAPAVISKTSLVGSCHMGRSTRCPVTTQRGGMGWG